MTQSTAQTNAQNPAKKFEVPQKVENPQLVEKFLHELINNPPKAVDDLEKKKRNFASRKGGTTILNRDLIAVIKDKKIKIPRNF